MKGAVKLGLWLGAIALSLSLTGTALAQTPPAEASATPPADAITAAREAQTQSKVQTTPPLPRAAAATPRRAGPLATKPQSPSGQTAEVVRTAVILTLLGLLPAMAICMTPFIRIVVVLSMIRHAFGMPETPPNQVLVAIALFLTAFIMAPTVTTINSQTVQPFLNGAIPVQQAIAQGSAPLKAFMLRQVHDQDIKTVYDIARRPLPARASEVGLMELTTAFMLNELRVSFKIGFVILLPFLLIDLVISSILLALGMMMVPPSTISLPIKVLMFVLIDGWSLILEGIAGSFR